MGNTADYQTIDEYIAQFAPEVQKKMQTLRRVIREAAPQAEERLSWQMPTFYLHGNLVHFAGHKSHIGFYPGANGVEHFQSKLMEYHTTKGGIQFPLKDAILCDLVDEIVRFRVAENLKWAEEKRTPKKRE